MVITPVKDASGMLRGYAKVTCDMSEQRRVLELQRGSQRVTELLLAGAAPIRVEQHRRDVDSFCECRFSERSGGFGALRATARNAVNEAPSAP